jgi:hypothetical protein
VSQREASRTAPDWGTLREHALEPANLPRVLAGIGFSRQVGPIPRGGSRLFRRQDLRRPTRHIPRETCAALNRAYMARPCRLLVRDPPPGPRLIIDLDTVTGAWQDPTGGQRGEDVIDLAALALGCRYGQAAWRVARLCGLPQVPHGHG